MEEEIEAFKMLDRTVRERVPQAIEVAKETCQRAGSLAAYGLADRQLADSLLLSLEQMAWVRNTADFKIAFADAVQAKQQRLQDLEDGWDGIEERAIAQVLEVLEYGKNPDYALRAAAVANRAERRSPGSGGRVIDARNTTNVIVLTMNRNYIAGAAQSETHAVIDIEATPTEPKVIPRRQVDLPSPKAVAKILGTEKKGTLIEQMVGDSIRDQARRAGIDISLFEDE